MLQPPGLKASLRARVCVDEFHFVFFRVGPGAGTRPPVRKRVTANRGPLDGSDSRQLDIGTTRPYPGGAERGVGRAFAAPGGAGLALERCWSRSPLRASLVTKGAVSALSDRRAARGGSGEGVACGRENEANAPSPPAEAEGPECVKWGGRRRRVGRYFDAIGI